jgi:hypothetical protein
MNKILTTRENKGLFFNSALKTRSYSDDKKSNSFPYFLLFFFLLLKVCSGFRQKKTKTNKKLGDPSGTGSLIPRREIEGKGLDPH